MPSGRIATHGHSKRSDPNRPSPTYRAWQALKKRCLYPGNVGYPKYASLWYEPWRSFETFLADMGARPVGTTLDRKDTLKPYSPSNCRWATATQQARNRVNNKLTLEIAREIRWSADKARVAAERFGVSETLVRKIRADLTWRE